ncbi:aminopeptidase [Thermoclostridium stercorarium subsp. leptospartum DSM 9219]|jgi:putative aminopeptidase FrvX|uniref:Aminopeptidase n=1 Tax=Thermoclostridium stercorarium subsp. leptospartum DSM 9219 TaxID=1346611 RepID=A0A1B1YIH2_THEST|nr:M20/M25/M40 family metallo-hydrolase [Thermoclostridium stercorarium]ANX00579.1 aminopeptidase [Thermoclostridium stercorarium subsp. leptospartum DSM 9219]
MDTVTLVKQLCDLNAPVGSEHLAAEKLKSLFEPYCDEVYVDDFFNVTGYKKGTSDKPGKIIITAHYDQIGMIVSGFEKGGFLRISNLGGVDTKALLAREVIVHGREEVYGVIGAKPPHLLKDDETNKNVSITELFIDTGYPDDVIKQKVSVGDPVTVVASVAEMKNRCVAGRSLDNRAGVAALVLILKELRNIKHPNDIYVIATVQEETGLLGAVASSYSLEPDLAVVIDVCHGDMPDADKSQCFPLNKGVPVGVGPAFHSEYTGALFETARRERIPTQRCIEPGNPGTEAWAIQVSRTGVPTVEVGIPLRYMHTTAELISLQDLENAAVLVARYVSGDILKKSEEFE